MSKLVATCHITKTVVNDYYFKKHVTKTIVDDYGLKFVQTVLRTVIGELQF